MQPGASKKRPHSFDTPNSGVHFSKPKRRKQTSGNSRKREKNVAFASADGLMTAAGVGALTNDGRPMGDFSNDGPRLCGKYHSLSRDAGPTRPVHDLDFRQTEGKRNRRRRKRREARAGGFKVGGDGVGGAAKGAIEGAIECALERILERALDGALDGALERALERVVERAKRRSLSAGEGESNENHAKSSASKAKTSIRKVEPWIAGCTKLARPPTKEWIVRPSTHDQTVSEGTTASQPPKPGLINVGRNLVQCHTDRWDTRGQRSKPAASCAKISKPVPEPYAYHQSVLETQDEDNLDGTQYRSGPRARSSRPARPSISNGMIQVKRIRGARHVSLSDYANQEVDAATTEKHLEEISAALDDSDTESSDGEPAIERAVRYSTTKAAVDGTYQLCAGAVHERNSAAGNVSHSGVVLYEHQPASTQSGVRLRPVETKKTLLSAKSGKRASGFPANGILEDTRSRTRTFSSIGASGPLKRISPNTQRVWLEDTTSEHPFEQYTYSSEPEAPRPWRRFPNVKADRLAQETESQAVQESESEDVWENIDLVAEDVLGSPTAVASIENCKPSPTPVTKGLEDVLMMDDRRSWNSPKAARVMETLETDNRNSWTPLVVKGAVKAVAVNQDTVEDFSMTSKESQDRSIVDVNGRAVGQAGNLIADGDRCINGDGEETLPYTEDASNPKGASSVHETLRNQASQDEHSDSEASSLSSTPLSELSRTPTPPVQASESIHQRRENYSPQVVIPFYIEEALESASAKRRTTGNTSKHFSTPKARTRKRGSDPVPNDDDLIPANVLSDSGAVGSDLTVTRETRSAALASASPKSNQDHDNGTEEVGSHKRARRKKVLATPNATPVSRTPKSLRKSTGKISEHFIESRVDKYNTTASSRRAPAGVSVAPAPSINEKKFGLIQEEYWDQPFWMLVAVTLLNRTTGRAAVPVFKKIMQRYSTLQDLAQAKHEDILELIKHLGFQNNRTKTLLRFAQMWIETPSVCGRLYRTKDYPNKGDGKAVDIAKIVEEDMPICSGALEIGHLYGCGAYAYDSWRIFCRDVLRGVADDYNGKNATADDFEPEWKRVVPGDKELRACLRWMWLREGWVWDPLTGNKRRATAEEMERAVEGEMAIDDPQERKFARMAAGEQVSPVKHGYRGDSDSDEADDTPSKRAARHVHTATDGSGDEEKASIHPAISETPNKIEPAASNTTSDPDHRPSLTRSAKAVRSIELDDNDDLTRARSSISSHSRSASAARTKSKTKSSEPVKQQMAMRSSTKKRRSDVYDVPVGEPARRSTRLKID